MAAFPEPAPSVLEKIPANNHLVRKFAVLSPRAFVLLERMTVPGPRNFWRAPATEVYSRLAWVRRSRTFIPFLPLRYSIVCTFHILDPIATFALLVVHKSLTWLGILRHGTLPFPTFLRVNVN